MRTFLLLLAFAGPTFAHPVTDEVDADLRNGSVLRVAEPADQSDDVQAELVAGQRDRSLGLGPVRLLVGHAGRAMATANGEIQPHDTSQGVGRRRRGEDK